MQKQPDKMWLLVVLSYLATAGINIKCLSRIVNGELTEDVLITTLGCLFQIYCALCLHSLTRKISQATQNISPQFIRWQR